LENLFFMLVYKSYDLGARVYQVMSEKHILPTQFARMLGVSPNSVFRLFKMKSADLDKIRRISVAMNYDFIAEIGATSQNMKAIADLEAAGEVAAQDFASKESKLREELGVAQAKIAAQESVIEKLRLEVGYLKEVVEAYKGK
jgi:transcriptional regulator with XRE-family HTH domain